MTLPLWNFSHFSSSNIPFIAFLRLWLMHFSKVTSRGSTLHLLHQLYLPIKNVLSLKSDELILFEFTLKSCNCTTMCVTIKVCHC